MVILCFQWESGELVGHDPQSLKIRVARHQLSALTQGVKSPVFVN